MDNLDQTLAGYFGPIGTDSTTNDFLIGQEFTLPTGNPFYTLNKITLLLDPENGSGDITVSIYGVDANNNPTNPIAFVVLAIRHQFGERGFHSINQHHSCVGDLLCRSVSHDCCGQ